MVDVDPGPWAPVHLLHEDDDVSTLVELHVERLGGCFAAERPRKRSRARKSSLASRTVRKRARAVKSSSTTSTTSTTSPASSSKGLPPADPSSSAQLSAGDDANGGETTPTPPTQHAGAASSSVPMSDDDAVNVHRSPTIVKSVDVVEEGEIPSRFKGEPALEAPAKGAPSSSSVIEKVDEDVKMVEDEKVVEDVEMNEDEVVDGDVEMVEDEEMNEDEKMVQDERVAVDETVDADQRAGDEPILATSAVSILSDVTVLDGDAPLGDSKICDETMVDDEMAVCSDGDAPLDLSNVSTIASMDVGDTTERGTMTSSAPAKDAIERVKEKEGEIAGETTRTDATLRSGVPSDEAHCGAQSMEASTQPPAESSSPLPHVTNAMSNDCGDGKGVAVKVESPDTHVGSATTDKVGHTPSTSTDTPHSGGEETRGSGVTGNDKSMDVAGDDKSMDVAGDDKSMDVAGDDESIGVMEDALDVVFGVRGPASRLIRVTWGPDTFQRIRGGAGRVQPAYTGVHFFSGPHGVADALVRCRADLAAYHRTRAWEEGADPSRARCMFTIPVGACKRAVDGRHVWLILGAGDGPESVMHVLFLPASPTMAEREGASPTIPMAHANGSQTTRETHKKTGQPPNTTSSTTPPSGTSTAPAPSSGGSRDDAGSGRSLPRGVVLGAVRAVVRGAQAKAAARGNRSSSTVATPSAATLPTPGRCEVVTLESLLGSLAPETRGTMYVPSPPGTSDAGGDGADPQGTAITAMLDCRVTHAPQWLSHHTRLTTLSLAHNGLHTLPDVVVERATGLKHLVLAHNQLEELPEGVASLKCLRLLDVHSNRLKALPAVDALHQLRYVRASHNALEALPAGMPALAHLRYLNVASNRLPRDALGGGPTAYPSLRTLVAHRNDTACFPRVSIPRGRRGPPPPMREVDLSQTQLDALPDHLSSLQGLRVLRAARNRLEEFPRAACSLADLHTLDVRANALTTLPMHMSGLRSLHSLYMGKNPMKHVPEVVWELPSLRTLDLSFMRLHSLPPQVSVLTGLQVLRLRETLLKSVPPELGELECLVELDLSLNNMAVLPEPVLDLPNLRTLELMYNMLPQLPAEMHRLDRLRNLDVSHNKLTELPVAIHRLTGLRQLDVSCNKLTHIPNEVVQLPRLRWLSFGYNKLSGEEKKSLKRRFPS